MERNKIVKLLFLWIFISITALHSSTCFGQSVPFATNGTLKMMYDRRMNPQALERNEDVYIVWRGNGGYPYITSYDLKSRKFSKPYQLPCEPNSSLDQKIKKDHHYSPVIWADRKGHLHVLFGCHRTPGIHLVSRKPEDITEWKESSSICESISYPQAHQIYDNKILAYFRKGGHLGAWTYRISSDNGKTWKAPPNPVVDLNVEPKDGLMADHAGSYHSTRIGSDGKTLHVAFIWKVENPVLNSRYQSELADHTRRYNLYYIKIDLPSGNVMNYDGKVLVTPISKKVADEKCLIWDTEERIAAVPPSLYINEKDTPYFLLTLSDETPYRCKFYFVRNTEGKWKKTAIAQTSHYFNAGHLDKSEDGILKAYLVVSDKEIDARQGMDLYGWGHRIEEWVSRDNGENWLLSKDLTPLKDYRYQNIKFVSKGSNGINRDIILFYGWQETDGNGTAFLWDDRPLYEK